MTDIDASIVGYASGALCTFCMLPQLIKCLRTKSARDISYGFLLILFLGLALGVTYGAMIRQVPIMASNSASLVLNSILLVIKMNESRGGTKVVVAAEQP